MTAPRMDSPDARRTTAKKAQPSTGARPDASALGRKLGIRRGTQLALVNAPEGFERQLEPLPNLSGFPRDRSTPLDLVVLFADTRLDLSTLLPTWARRLKAGGALWIAWPKNEANLPTDLNHDEVRRAAAAQGLRDDRECAIDHVWCALRFVPQKKNP